MTDKVTKRWIRSAVDELAVKEGCWFDEREAAHSADFFPRFLRHSKGQWAGEPFDLLPWQRDDVILPLFGWKRKDGTRRYRRGYIEIPKKNGKSTLFSGLNLKLLCADNEAGAEVYAAAVDRQQAGIVFGESAAMVRKSPALSKRLRIVETTKTIYYAAREAKYSALSADAYSSEGLNIHAATVDELHAHKNSRLFSTLRYGGASRRQPLFLAITTAGVYDPETIGWEQHEYARRVIAGIIEDWSFLGLIYCADPEEDWTQEKTWKHANPSYGLTLNSESFREECEEAKHSARARNDFLRYRLNIWTNQVEAWIQPEDWQSCKSPLPLFDYRELLKHKPCYAGLDLASKIDLTALVLAWMIEGKTYFLARFWVPEERIAARLDRGDQSFKIWSDQGWLRTTPGAVTDYDFVRKEINSLRNEFNIREIGIDPYNSSQIATDLMSDGFEVVEYRQGAQTLGESIKAFEAKVLDRSIVHNGDPVLAWCVNNAVLKLDSNENPWIDRKESTAGGKKVDGVVAAVMAIKGLIDGRGGDSVYETRGVIQI